MAPYSFGPWRFAVDPVRTARATTALTPVDPTCCNACATFQEALIQHRLAGPLAELLMTADADPARPQEVWGAPDSGMLSAWWVIAGELLVGPATASAARTAAVDLGEQRAWITTELAMQPPAAFGEGPLLQVELLWEGPSLIALEQAAWPPTTPGRAV